MKVKLVFSAVDVVICDKLQDPALGELRYCLLVFTGHILTQEVNGVPEFSLNLWVSHRGLCEERKQSLAVYLLSRLLSQHEVLEPFETGYLRLFKLLQARSSFHVLVHTGDFVYLIVSFLQDSRDERHDTVLNQLAVFCEFKHLQARKHHCGFCLRPARIGIEVSCSFGKQIQVMDQPNVLCDLGALCLALGIQLVEGLSQGSHIH